ncbi:Odorant receptor 218 [Nylanderia fulva]|uniref:Odorant receptor n=1 Tax=Nylanderia fulva TaxID=613905 RepID=A0A6G1LPQ6_9HYME|nr:odorant receptor Or2-like [Nylanderia fulva]KAF3054608.1 Odorant receptor 218 [Nylanderia fulva]
MEHPEERYYKLNRFYLSVTGLWPYQSTWRARFSRTIITIIMLSCLFTQISSIFTSDVDLDFLSDSLIMIMPTVGNLTHLYSRLVNIDKFKELYELMWDDWALEKTDDEIKIMHQYAETARVATIYCSVTIYTIIIGYIVWLFIPVVFGIIRPVNESLLQSAIHVEFYIDVEQYIYIVLFYLSIVIILIPLVFLASMSLYLTVTHHVCGMCELLGNRAEHLFYVIKDETERDLIRGTKISCKNIVFFVQQHSNIIRFVNLIETSHTLPFLMDLIGMVTSISFSLLKLSFGTRIENRSAIFVSITLIIIDMIYLILPNYMGQKITDMSSILCEKVYNSAWYNADVSQQKSLLLIMCRRFYPLVLTACKFYPMSLPSFKMIFQMAVTYFMFMRKI